MSDGKYIKRDGSHVLVGTPQPLAENFYPPGYGPEEQMSHTDDKSGANPYRDAPKLELVKPPPDHTTRRHRIVVLTQDEWETLDKRSYENGAYCVTCKHLSLFHNAGFCDVLHCKCEY